jgi:hypothetical protein
MVYDVHATNEDGSEARFEWLQRRGAVARGGALAPPDLAPDAYDGHEVVSR